MITVDTLHYFVYLTYCVKSCVFMTSVKLPLTLSITGLVHLILRDGKEVHADWSIFCI